MTLVSQILPAAKAVHDMVFNLSEPSASKSDVIRSLHELQQHLQDVNFTQQPPLDNILLYKWTFASLTDLRNRSAHSAAFQWLIPKLDTLLVVFDNFLETAHLVADGELITALQEIKSNDYHNYDEITDLDAL